MELKIFYYYKKVYKDWFSLLRVYKVFCIYWKYLMFEVGVGVFIDYFVVKLYFW